MAQTLEQQMEEALRGAVDAAGGQNATAKKLGTTQSTVWGWIHKIRKCPAERVVELEAACHGRITRHQLRPDLFDMGALANAIEAGEAA